MGGPRSVLARTSPVFAGHHGPKHWRGRRSAEVRSGRGAGVFCAAWVDASRGAFGGAGSGADESPAAGIGGGGGDNGVNREAGRSVLVGDLPVFAGGYFPPNHRVM